MSYIIDIKHRPKTTKISRKKYTIKRGYDVNVYKQKILTSVTCK